ncbi:MAG: hypothetical protein BZY88_00675 [SAR202 cluster bacterium Io17-Chloro-G9]|nr:MAG: hypothetical protein BZY88_00675 [SAR202 cluster bacterium Io17-Chloro-G9]
MPWAAFAWPVWILVSYFIGSLPTAYLITRLANGQDIRRLGDRNAGAANVYRSVGAKAGLGVGIIDIAKGAVAVLLVKGLVDSTSLEMAAGVAALAGHNWPVHLGLQGGRGAAAAVGVLLAALPALAIPLGLISLVVLFLTRSGIKSLGSFLIAVPVMAGVILWVGANSYSYPITAYALAIPLFVGLSHYTSVKLDLYRHPEPPDLNGQPGKFRD